MPTHLRANSCVCKAISAMSLDNVFGGNSNFHSCKNGLQICPCLSISQNCWVLLVRCILKKTSWLPLLSQICNLCCNHQLLNSNDLPTFVAKNAPAVLSDSLTWTASIYCESFSAEALPIIFVCLSSLLLPKKRGGVKLYALSGVILLSHCNFYQFYVVLLSHPNPVLGNKHLKLFKQPLTGNCLVHSGKERKD